MSSLRLGKRLEQQSPTNDRELLRHDCGRPVEIDISPGNPKALASPAARRGQEHPCRQIPAGGKRSRETVPARARSTPTAEGYAPRRSEEDAEHQRDHARAVLVELDRPLVRRLHRSDIAHAQSGLSQAQHTIDRCGRYLAELDKRIPNLRASLGKAEGILADRPGLERERHGIRRELDGDLSVRARSIADDPPEHVTDRLGPRPKAGRVADLWDEAAARLDQHESAFPSNSEYRHLGASRFWDDTPMGASHRAVDQACNRLDRGLGRGHGIEPRGLELGISR